MKQDSWYKRLLCGYNLLGDFADLACRGTEVEYELDQQEREQGVIGVRCWCCTFWRGVVIGSFFTSLMAGVWYVAT